VRWPNSTKPVSVVVTLKDGKDGESEMKKTKEED